MGRNGENVRELKFPGAVAADNHVLDAPDVCERYPEAKYKPRAKLIVHDRKAVEHREIGGRPGRASPGPTIAQRS